VRPCGRSRCVHMGTAMKHPISRKVKPTWTQFKAPLKLIILSFARRGNIRQATSKTGKCFPDPTLREDYAEGRKVKPRKIPFRILRRQKKLPDRLFTRNLEGERRTEL